MLANKYVHDSRTKFMSDIISKRHAVEVITGETYNINRNRI